MCGLGFYDVAVLVFVVVVGGGGGGGVSRRVREESVAIHVC